MDPILKMWMFQNWIADQNDNMEIAKNHAYLVGSFYNPEAVKKLLDEDNKHISSDEDFEASTKLMLQDREIKSQNESKRKRKRKLKK